MSITHTEMGMTMATITALDDLWICPDCALILANDDDSGVGDAAAHRSAMARVWAEYVGVYGPSVEMVVGDDTQDFSPRMCDACGSRLAGERLSATLLGYGFVEDSHDGITRYRHGSRVMVVHDATGEPLVEWDARD